MKPHWTAEISNMWHALSIDFVDDIYEVMVKKGITTEELAEKLGCSPEDLTSLFGGPDRLPLSYMIEMAKAVGLKISLVAYDDEDPEFCKPPLIPELFRASWEKCGKPSSIPELEGSE